jgi:multiple sugar transport system permease protein
MDISISSEQPMQNQPGGLARSQRRIGWLMAAPAVVLILLLSVFPLVYSLGLSFLQWDLQTPERPFVGLRNYAQALADARVYGALGNTALITVVAVALELALGLALALLLVDELRGKGVIIPLLMLPVMMTPIVVAFTWRMLWDAQYGAINQILGVFSNEPVRIVWLGSKSTALFAMTVTEVWQWTPFMFLILLAGLAGISPELYEAASIDGASYWQGLRFITLPALAPVIAVAVLFRALDAFKVFDLVYIFTQGGPGTSTETISWYIYQLGFKFFRMGYAAAISYLVLIVLSVLATLYVGRFVRGRTA